MKDNTCLIVERITDNILQYKIYNLNCAFTQQIICNFDDNTTLHLTSVRERNNYLHSNLQQSRKYKYMPSGSILYIENEDESNSIIQAVNSLSLKNKIIKIQKLKTILGFNDFQNIFDDTNSVN